MTSAAYLFPASAGTSKSVAPLAAGRVGKEQRARAEMDELHAECHLCKSVLLEKGVPLFELDLGKLSEWWKSATGRLLVVDTLMEEPALCRYCIFDARYAHESGGNSDDVWWPTDHDSDYYRYLAGKLNPFSEISEEKGKTRSSSIEEMALIEISDSSSSSSDSEPDEKLKCDVCDRRFLKARLLQDHLVLDHDIKEAAEQLWCEACKKSYLTPQKFREHNKSVHSSKPVICQRCGMSFKYRALLRYHIQKHCSKSRKSGGSSKKAYTNELFECVYCGIKKDTSRGINIHIRKVHTNFLFRCLECRKYFQSEEERDGHMLQSHDLPIPEPTKCGVAGCSLSFVWRKERDAHVATCHPGVVRCALCEFCTMNKFDLTTHFRRHHVDTQIKSWAKPRKHS